MPPSPVVRDMKLDFSALRENLFPASHGAIGDLACIPLAS
ncbi:hypothetical protein GGE07_005999 [Sinorhizobium terangae]|nr:hypothetical protein [Sinorhizobium terangae]